MSRRFSFVSVLTRHFALQVRRSGTGTLEQHEDAIRQLVAQKNFVVTREKETLTDPSADIKFVNLGVVSSTMPFIPPPSPIHARVDQCRAHRSFDENRMIPKIANRPGRAHSL